MRDLNKKSNRHPQNNGEGKTWITAVVSDILQAKSEHIKRLSEKVFQKQEIDIVPDHSERRFRQVSIQGEKVVRTKITTIRSSSKVTVKKNQKSYVKYENKSSLTK